MRLRGSPKAFTVFGLLIGLLLAGCAAGGDDGNSYPELSSVPNEPRPSLPVEERRKIVRGLIKERDQSRHQTSVVRGRSGLSTSAYESPEDDDAEAIIPDEPGEAETFTLRGDGEGDASSSYRSGAQFDDGSLDDFIRQLERDTSPGVPDVSEEPEPEDASGDETSFLLHETDDMPPVILAAFAPVLTARHDLGRDLRIRLAADENEDDSSFFCDWFGWSVGMLGACLKEEGGEGSGADAKAGDNAQADVNDGGRMQQDGTTGNGASSQNRRLEAERRLRGDDASDAIENLSRDALDPVKSSLEKLRDFMRARRSGDPDASPAERRAYRGRGDVGADDAPVDHPPVPLAKPKIRADIDIEDGGETFRFRRMQHPAFKPAAAVVTASTEGTEQSTSNSEQDKPADPKTKPPDDKSDSEAEKEAVEEKTAGSDAGTKETTGPSASKSEKDETTDSSTASSDGKGDVVDEQEKGGEKTAASQAGTEQTDQKQEETEVAARTSDDVQNEPEAGSKPKKIGIMVLQLPFAMEFERDQDGLSVDQRGQLAQIVDLARKEKKKIRIIGEAESLQQAEDRIDAVNTALMLVGDKNDLIAYEVSEKPDLDQVRFVLETPKEKKEAEATPAEE